MSVKQFKKVGCEKEDIISALEKWISELRSGKEKARTAVLVWRDGENETVAYTPMGVISGSSSLIGMLHFASCMIFDRTKRVN